LAAEATGAADGSADAAAGAAAGAAAEDADAVVPVVCADPEGAGERLHAASTSTSTTARREDPIATSGAPHETRKPYARGRVDGLRSAA
jgi:hypothetical protein